MDCCVVFSSTNSVDGGWAWIILGASSLLLFFVGGTLASFGVLYVGINDYYSQSSSSSLTNSSMLLNSTTTVSRDHDNAKVVIACVGSLSVSLVCFIGPIMNGLIEKFGPQRVLLVGTALVVAGFLLSSFSDSIWQLFLTYSVPVGVGCSFVWTTSLSLLPHYFERWLTVASSVAMTGRFLGMAIITPISRSLMKSYGWRRMLQFFTLIGVPMCACAALFRPSAGSRRRKIDAMRRVGNCCKLQRNVRLTFYCWIGALQCTAITIPMTYIVEYAEETVEVDEEQSGFLLTAMAVTAAFSSIATGLIGLRIKRKMFLVQLLIAVGGLSSLLFPFYQSYQHLIVYMIIQGVCFGYVSLVYLVPLTSQMIDVNDACDAFGLQSFAMAFGSLGTAIGGGLHDLVGSYTPGFLLSGSISVVVSVILFLDEYLKKKCGRKGKYSIEKTTGTAEADAAAVATKDDIRTAIYYETYV